MSQPVSVLASGVLNAASVPATAKVTANARVSAAAGPLGLITDVMLFPGPQVVGNWIVGSSTVLINSIPTVNQVSTGICTGPAPVTPGPMTVAMGDPRIKAM